MDEISSSEGFSGETLSSEALLVAQFLRHRDIVLGFIFALTRNHDVAEEVFQEVGLAITDEARRGRRVDNFLAWAREIARRRVAAYYRVHAQRRGIVPLSEGMMDVIERGFAENERLEEEAAIRFRFLHECLERLAGRSRQVIEQRYQFGKSIAAIADLLDWKPDSVKVALSRARKQLAACVKNKLRLYDAGLHEAV